MISHPNYPCGDSPVLILCAERDDADKQPQNRGTVNAAV